MHKFTFFSLPIFNSDSLWYELKLQGIKLKNKKVKKKWRERSYWNAIFVKKKKENKLKLNKQKMIMMKLKDQPFYVLYLKKKPI